MLRAAELSMMRYASHIPSGSICWVTLDALRADAEHSAQVGEIEPRFAIDDDDAHLIVGLTHSSVAAHLARTWRRQQRTSESRHRHTLRM